ncbi:MAG: hypothetical protein P1V35_04240 [Planctomycetota bacterium]|nr:hypothetical protein [Planctomycetota bacterium]
MASYLRTRWGSRSLVLLDQGVLSGFAFLTTLVLIRGMGLEGFGVYSLLALGWMWGLGVVQALLLQPMQTLLGSRIGQRRRAYLSGCWRLAVGCMGMASALAALVVFGLGSSALVAVGFAFFLVARALQMQLRGAAFAVGERRQALVSDAIGQGGGFLAIVWLGPLLDWSLHSILLIQAAAWGAAAGYSWMGFEGRGVRSLPLRAMALRHWRFGRWLVGMAVVRWVASNGFLLAVAAQFGPSSLAIVRGVQAIVGVANLGLAAMESVLPTGAAVEAGRDGERGLFRYLRGFALKGFVPVGLLVVCLLWIPGPCLVLVFGKTPPEGAREMLMGLAFLPASSFLYTLYSVAYRTLRKTRALFWCYGALAILVAGVAPTVVGTYGLAGAAWGMALQPMVLALWLACGLAVRSGSRSKPAWAQK